jgi:hypothetical protein
LFRAELSRSRGAAVTNLAQAYIHLKPYPASDRKVRSLGRYAQKVALKAAADIYGGGVEVDIEIEEGSLITRITVVGGLLLSAYSTIADYKGFKDSVVEMCDDAREFAVDVCNPFVKKAGVPNEDVYRFERRLKTPGRLYRLSKRLEKLEHSVNELSPRAIQKELASLRAELDAATKDLSASDTDKILAGLKRPKLPPPEKWPIPEEPRIAVGNEDEYQSVLFEDESSGPEPVHKRRLVFKSTAAVPKRGRKGRPKKKAAAPDLLPH